jgi:hypothetical protein
MTDLQTLPGQRCLQYVDASFVSYPCWLAFGHDGPHVAHEVPVSAQRRKIWEQEQEKEKQAQHSAPALQQTPSAPVAGVPSPPPALDPAMLADPVERERNHIASLHGKEFRDLPEWVKSAIIASSSQTSLTLLWTLCHREFKRGATSVTISPDFLERLLTPAVRDFVSHFDIKE